MVGPFPARAFSKSISCPSVPLTPIWVNRRDGLNWTK
jgi:hypothetical protein